MARYASGEVGDGDGLGDGLGDGVGDADGLGDGEGLGDGDGEGTGLGAGVAVGVGVEFILLETEPHPERNINNAEKNAKSVVRKTPS
ncbi:MAG TPA: hypothetical protein VFP59_16120 [Candidatus Angelobacter sp.]|nr:hypothetical protein [Candidatus Angelobacter sp.]